MAKYFNFGKNVPKRKQDEALDSEAEKILDAYFRDESDSGRFTSVEIADNVRETLKVTTAQVFDYMSSHGYRLERVDDRLVWVID